MIGQDVVGLSEDPKCTTVQPEWRGIVSVQAIQKYWPQDFQDH